MYVINETQLSTTFTLHKTVELTFEKFWQLSFRCSLRRQFVDCSKLGVSPLYICIYVYTYVCVCECVCMCVRVYVCVRVCACVPMYVYMEEEVRGLLKI